MRRRKPQPWYTDIRARLRFEREARARYPDLTCAGGRGRGARITYGITVMIPEYGERRVCISLINGFEPFGAEIRADGPSDSPHRFADGCLCIWYPSDPDDRKWVGGDGLAELIAHVRIHLFKEAYWRETGEWLGPEAPHEIPKPPSERESR